MEKVGTRSLARGWRAAYHGQLESRAKGRDGPAATNAGQDALRLRSSAICRCVGTYRHPDRLASDRLDRSGR